MKRFIIAIAALVMSIANVNAQRLGNISVEAQYITDKMAVELGLDSRQRNSILQLNLNYLSGITSYRDIDSKIWRKRNSSLKSLLNRSQWLLYQKASYFYRPIGWKDGTYVHRIYDKYPKGYGRPDGPMPPKHFGRPGPEPPKHYDRQGPKPGKKHGKHNGKDNKRPGNPRPEPFGHRR